MTDTRDITAALVILAARGIPADVQELLVHGDAARGIAPGALAAALAVYHARKLLFSPAPDAASSPAASCEPAAGQPDES